MVEAVAPLDVVVVVGPANQVVAVVVILHALDHVKLIVTPIVQMDVIALVSSIALIILHIEGLLREYDISKKQCSPLAVRHGEKHHLHRHQGLPVGLQVLLSCGQEREGTHALGGGKDLHRLCARP